MLSRVRGSPQLLILPRWILDGVFREMPQYTAEMNHCGLLVCFLLWWFQLLSLVLSRPPRKDSKFTQKACCNVCRTVSENLEETEGFMQFLSWGRPQSSSKGHQMFAFLGRQYVTPIEVQRVNTARNWDFPSPLKPPAKWIIAVLWANEGKTHRVKALPSITEEAFGKSEAESPMN